MLSVLTFPVRETARSNIAEAIQAFVPDIFQRSLRLIELHPKFCYHRPRPRHSLDLELRSRLCIRRLRGNFASSTETPQEAVHLDGGEHRVDNTAFQGATHVALTATHMPFPLAVPLFHRHVQPSLAQHIPGDDALSHRFEEVKCGILSKYFDKSASTTSV